MNARLILLGLTVSLTLLLTLPTTGLGSEHLKAINKPTADQGFQYDRQMVEGAPEKKGPQKPVLPCIVLAWESLL